MGVLADTVTWVAWHGLPHARNLLDANRRPRPTLRSAEASPGPVGLSASSMRTRIQAR